MQLPVIVVLALVVTAVTSESHSQPNTLETSECHAVKGCPRSAMVWASGAFMTPSLFSPAAFRHVAGLDLKLSLCCGYKFNGLLLRNQDLWDTFLEELLSATPLSMLSLEAKNKFFPSSLAKIHDTLQFHRTIDSTFSPNEQDIAFRNDGDGDILVLTVGEGITSGDARSLQRQLAVISPNLFGVRVAGQMPVDGLLSVSSTLKITNAVLKCKCPHNLFVMPAMDIFPESIPSVSIVAGPRCGMVGSELSTGDHSKLVKMTEETSFEEGAVPATTRLVGRVSFRTSSAIPPFTTVQWVVLSKEGRETNTSLSSIVPLSSSLAQIDGVVVAPNVRYTVELTLSREETLLKTSMEFILRVPVSPLLIDADKEKTELLVDTPHFGANRRVVLTPRNLISVQKAMHTGFFTAFWQHTYGVLKKSSSSRLDEGSLAEVAFSHEITNASVHRTTVINVPLKLRLGRNLIQLFVQDVDKVCPATKLQEEVVDALLAQILHPVPPRFTACEEAVELLARDSEPTYAGMKRKYPAYFNPQQGDAFFTRWNCSEVRPSQGETCRFRNGASSDIHRQSAIMIAKKSVRHLQWTIADLPIAAEAFSQHPAHFDTSCAFFSPHPDSNQRLLTILSDQVTIYRRLSSVPPLIDSTINTRQETLELEAPAEAEGGRWEVSAPFRTILVSKNNLRVTISCTSMVNFAAHTERAGAIRFMAADRGEDITEDAVRVRCPDSVVEYQIRVAPEAPPPVVPAKEHLYTDQNCLTIPAPRANHRDEKIEWKLDAASGLCAPLVVSAASITSASICGIQEGSSCQVVWNAANMVGAVMKVFVVHRCLLGPVLILTDREDEKKRIEPIRVNSRDGSCVPPAAAAAASGEAFLVVPVAASNAVVIGYSMLRSARAATDAQNPDQFTATFEVGKQLRVASLHGSASSPFLLPALNPAAEDGLDGNDEGQPHHKHDVAGRKIEMFGLSAPSHLYPATPFASACTNISFTIHPDTPAELAQQQLAAEFAKRGMCRPSQGGWRMFAVVPLATIHHPLRRLVAERPEDAVVALHVCAATFEYFVHPSLHREYGFEFTWDCPASGSKVAVAKVSPTQSRLTLPAENGTAEACALTAINRVSATRATTLVLLRRVFPASLTVEFEILSPNELKKFFEAKTKAQGGAPAHKADSSASLGAHAGGRHKRIVGRHAIVRATNVHPHGAVWSIVNHAFHEQPARSVQQRLPVFKPVEDASEPFASGTAALTSALDATSAVTMISAIAVSGIYTVQVTRPDAEHPAECPASASTFNLYTYFAEVVSAELDVCGSAAVLHAKPLPSELSREFVAQWEVVSHQVSTIEILHSGKDFQRIQFQQGSNRHRTTVLGLDFGIYHFRWAIYTNPAAAGSTRGRVLVDAALVKVNVLTENLPSERLVTLADTADIPITNSTIEWSLPAELLAQEQSYANLLTPRVKLTPVSEDFRRSNESAAYIRAEHIPIGSLKLEYTQHMSPKVAEWGSLFAKGSRCEPRKKLFDLTRVSAFLLANTSMQHECHAYLPKATITMCIHTSLSAAAAGSPKAATLLGPDDSAVQLVGADDIEAVIKAGSERLRTAACIAAPWWATSAADWTYTVNYEDDRCVMVEVKANRFLSFDEASQPLFAGRRDGSCQVKSGDESWLNDGSSFITSRILHSVNIHQKKSQRGARDDSKREAARMTPAKAVQQFVPVYESPQQLVTKTSARLAALRGLEKLPELLDNETSVATGSTLDIVLRLDVVDQEKVASSDISEPLLGGLFVPAKPQPKPLRSVPSVSEPTLLIKCINGTLLGEDLFPYFEESERGRADASGGQDVARGGAEELSAWEEYVRGTRLKRVPCEPVFQDLTFLMPTKFEQKETDSLEDEVNTINAQQTAAVTALRDRRRRLRVPQLRQQTIPLPRLEEQLASIAVHHTWTKDGIDTTGLSAEIQAALEQRRIKRWMVPEINKARRHLAPLDASFHSANKQLMKPSPLDSTDDVALSSSDEERLSRYMRAIAAYEATTGEAVSAISIKLPSWSKFVAPRTTRIRTRLPKALICGLQSGHGVDESDLLAATVTTRRLSILDDAPLVFLSSPGSIKQCEVEAEMPILRLNVSGTRFLPVALEATLTGDGDASHVAVAAVPPGILRFSEVFQSPAHEREDRRHGLGLAPCLGVYTKAAMLRLHRGSLKELEMRLPPCPAFRMLSQQDYNEEEDAEVLQRARTPRILRVTVHGAIAPDTYTASGRSSSTTSGYTWPSSQQQPIPEFDAAWSSAAGSDWRSFVRGADLIIDVIVRPTLARLQLRQPASRIAGAERSDSSSFSTSAPLMTCEGDLKSSGMEVLLELVGDTWSPPIGTPVLAPGGTSPAASSAEVEWGSHNTAMKNGFSIVEHHGVESTSHVLLAGRGIYRSHFLRYLHDEIYAMDEKDAGGNSRQRHTFVRRYNDTLIGIAIPPRASSTDRRSLHSEDDAMPRISSFSAVEEILFAVPGIATRCPGCLLAEATFFVAGDFSGIWTLSRAATLAAAEHELALPLQLTPAGLTTPLLMNFASSKTLPRQWRFSMLCPDTAHAAMRRALDRLPGQEPFLLLEVVTQAHKDIAGEDVPATAQQLVLFRSEPMPLRQALARIAPSAGLSSTNPTLAFTANESSLLHAYNLIASDFATRYGKRHLSTQFDYFEDDSFSEGLRALNASAILRLCHRSARAAGPQCTAAFVKPALIFIEDIDAHYASGSAAARSGGLVASLAVFPATLSSYFTAAPAADDPLAASPPSSAFRAFRARQRRQGQPKHTPLTWTRLVMLAAHHGGTAYLGVMVYLSLMAPPPLRRQQQQQQQQQQLPINSRNPVLADASTTKAVGIGMLMLAVGLYANAPWLWLALWALLWAVALVKMPSSTAGLLLAVHFVWLLSAAPLVRQMLLDA